MSLHALVPGTFDPPTLGHVDLVRRAARLFARVTVGIAQHPTKQALLDADERVALWEELLRDVDNAGAARIEGLVVDACAALGARVIVRGVRNGTDLDYELELARTNRALAPAIDTIFLAPAPAVAHVSSTLARQIAGLGGDVSALVPPPVARALAARLGRG